MCRSPRLLRGSLLTITFLTEGRAFDITRKEICMVIVRGKVARKVKDTRPIVSVVGLFAWVKDVAKAYAKDVRDGQRNSYRRFA